MTETNLDPVAELQSGPPIGTLEGHLESAIERLAGANTPEASAAVALIQFALDMARDRAEELRREKLTVASIAANGVAQTREIHRLQHELAQAKKPREATALPPVREPHFHHGAPDADGVVPVTACHEAHGADPTC